MVLIDILKSDEHEIAVDSGLVHPFRRLSDDGTSYCLQILVHERRKQNLEIGRRPVVWKDELNTKVRLQNTRMKHTRHKSV